MSYNVDNLCEKEKFKKMFIQDEYIIQYKISKIYSNTNIKFCS